MLNWPEQTYNIHIYSHKISAFDLKFLNVFTHLYRAEKSHTPNRYHFFFLMHPLVAALPVNTDGVVLD